MGYLMLKPRLYKNSSDTMNIGILLNKETKGFNPFPKCISLKVNIIVTGVCTCLVGAVAL